MSYDLLRLSLCSTICLSNQYIFFGIERRDVFNRALHVCRMLRLLYHPPPTTNPPCVSMHLRMPCALLLSWREGAPDGGGGVSLRIKHTTHTTPCKRRYLSLWVRLPDLHRVRPHYVDSTASRPICEVKLRQAGLVVWFVRTCEVLVLYFILQSFASSYFRVGFFKGWVRFPGSHMESSPFK